jgi:hypothetical protein
VKGEGFITRRLFAGQLLTLSALTQPALSQSEGTQADSGPLRLLRSGHPRLVLAESDFDRLRLVVRENSQARKLFSDLEKECDRLLSIPPVEYKLTPRLLPAATRLRNRVTTLALMYRLTGRDPWLRRAVMELNAAAAFKDWNPQRFNDTAEMTIASALGYDWLYNALTPEERTVIRDAISTHALDQAVPVYQKQDRWAKDRFSANIACNSAMAIGALAIAEDIPDKANFVLRSALQSIPLGLTSFGIEGGWPEGPAFAEFAMRFACLFFAALETAVGNDFNMSGIHGIDRAGRFRLYTTGPNGRTFNFSEGADDAGLAPEMLWMAKRFGVPQYAWSEQRQLDRPGARPEALDLAWFYRDPKAPAPPAFPLDTVIHSVNVATFRSSWEDPNAILLAVKGGDNKAPRSHFDLGTFILDAGGVRWASDLGPEDNVGTSARGSLYRVRTESHNVLVFDGENQDPRAEGRITRQEFGPDLAWVQLDLSKANGTKIRQWTRRIGLAQRQAVLISDVVRSDGPVEAMWSMMTEAEITLSGPTATLHRNGWLLTAEIRTPRHAVFDVTPARSPAGQTANPNFRRLIVRLGERITDLDLSLILTPYRDGQPKPKTTAQFPV